MQSYWITPLFTEDLRLKIKVISNSLSLEDFFKKLLQTPTIQKEIKRLVRGVGTVTIPISLLYLFHYLTKASYHGSKRCILR